MGKLRCTFTVLLSIISIIFHANFSIALAYDRSPASGFGSPNRSHKDLMEDIIKSSHYMKKVLKDQFCLKLSKREQKHCLETIRDRIIPTHQMWKCGNRYKNHAENKSRNLKILKCLKRVGTPITKLRQNIVYARSYLFSAYYAKKRAKRSKDKGDKKKQSAKAKRHARTGKRFLKWALQMFPEDGFSDVRDLLKQAMDRYVRWGNLYKAAWTVKKALSKFQVHKKKSLTKKSSVKKPRKRPAISSRPRKVTHKNPSFCNGGDCWYQRSWVERGLKGQPAVWYWSEVVEFIYKDGRRYRLGLTPKAIKRLGNPVLDIDCESNYRRIGLDSRGKVLPGDHFSHNRMRFVLNPEMIPIKSSTIEEVEFNRDGGFTIPSHINRATTPLLCKWIRTGNRQFNREWKSLLTTFPTVFAFFGFKMGTSVAMSYTKTVSRVATMNRMISKNRGYYRDWVTKWNAKNPNNPITKNFARLGKRARVTPLHRLRGKNGRAARRYDRKTDRHIAKLEKDGRAVQARKGKWSKQMDAHGAKVSNSKVRKWKSDATDLELRRDALRREADMWKKKSHNAGKAGYKHASKRYNAKKKALLRKANKLEKKANKLRNKVDYARPSKRIKEKIIKAQEKSFQQCQKLGVNSKAGKRALGQFTMYQFIAASIITLTTYVAVHAKEERNKKWYGALGWNTISALIGAYLPTLLLKGVDGGVVRQGIAAFSVSRLFDIGDTQGYQAMFGVSKKEAERQIKEMHNNPEKREALLELQKFLIKLSKTKRFRHLRKKYLKAFRSGQIYTNPTKKQMSNAEIRNMYTEAYRQYNYSKMKSKMNSGYLSSDRFYLNAKYGAVMSVPNIFVFATVVKYLCMGKKLLPLTIFTIHKVLDVGGKFLYRKREIGQ